MVGDGAAQPGTGGEQGADGTDSYFGVAAPSTRLTAKGGGGVTVTNGANSAGQVQILVDLVVEQTMLAIQDLQVKDPRTHHIVEQLDLISMEMLVVMDLVVQSIIMVVAVLVLLAEMVRQVVINQCSR